MHLKKSVVAALVGVVGVAANAYAQSGYDIPSDPKVVAQSSVAKVVQNLGTKNALTQLGKGKPVNVTLTQVGKGALKIQITCKSGGQSVTCAKGAKTLSGKSAEVVSIKPTAAGKKGLKKNRKVTIKTTFTPTGGKTVTSSKKVTLK